MSYSDEDASGEGLLRKTLRDLEAAEDEIERLKRGEWTAEEVHAICHNLPTIVGARAFADGCAAEQRRLYGCAPDIDAVATLAAELARARQDRDAQFAHNTSMYERLQELERDNEYVNGRLATLQGIIDGTGSTGSISGTLEQQARDLAKKVRE